MVRASAGWERHETPFGSFKVEVENAGNEVRVKTSVTLSKTRIRASEYSEFRAFCEATDKVLRGPRRSSIQVKAPKRMKRSLSTAFAVLALSGVLPNLAACSSVPTVSSPTTLASLRRQASDASDPELLGRWALARESIDPGGTGKEAKRARTLLEKKKGSGLLSNLARGIYDQSHGDPKSAADGFMATVLAAEKSDDPLTSLVAWYAARQLISLRGSVADLYDVYRKDAERLLDKPGHIGWRAVAELEDWRSSAIFDKAEATGKAYDALVQKRVGCAKGVRLAGPFGHAVAPIAGERSPPKRPDRGRQRGPWIRFVASRLACSRWSSRAASRSPRSVRATESSTPRHSSPRRSLATSSWPFKAHLRCGSTTSPCWIAILREWGVWQRLARPST